MKPVSLRQLCLDGLTLAPSQVLGSVRLVPILSDAPQDDLRLALRRYDDDIALADLGGGKNADHDHYVAYVPHGLIVDWTNTGEAASAYGGQLARRRKAKGPSFSVGVFQRVVRKEDRRRLRMLPLHVAMEGFLSLYFGGPEIAWSEYSRHALHRGLSPRVESSYLGRSITGLREALRVFEMHPGQCGCLVFVADALAAVTVVGHPDDYRALHRALLEDFYGELIFQYGLTYDSVGIVEGDAPAPRVRDLGELRAFVQRERAEAATTYRGMAGELFDREVIGERAYRMGAFSLERFMTDLDPARENHIGECIRRADGTIGYLKTFRLSAAQTRRAYLLRQLALHDWNIDRTAEALGTDHPNLILRMRNAGFGYLIQPHVLEAAARGRRR